MRRKLILGVLVLGAASMLCGFDSAETVDSLSQKMQEANSSLEGFSADINFNLDAVLNISDGTTDSSVPVTADGTIAADYAMNPLAMKADASVNVSALTTNQSITEEMYMVTDESGVLKMYVKVQETADDPGSWVVSSADDMNIAEIMESSANASASLGDLADWGITFELAPEAADVNGTECYLLSTVLDSSTINTILTKVSETSDIEIPAEVSTYIALLDGLKLNLDYYVDTTTYQLVKMHMDMNDSDLAMINQLITAGISGMVSDEAPASTAELVLNDLSLDALCSFGAAPAITVPDEALAAETSGEAVSLDDLASAAGDAVAN